MSTIQIFSGAGDGHVYAVNYNNPPDQAGWDDVHDATILQVTPAVVSRSVKLLENNVLRAMDALHIACALEWKADLFITSNKRQLDAAINSGLQGRYLD